MYRLPLGGPWLLCDTFPPFLPSSITGLAVVALTLLELPGPSLLGALHGCALTQDLTSSQLPQTLSPCSCTSPCFLGNLHPSYPVLHVLTALLSENTQLIHVFACSVSPLNHLTVRYSFAPKGTLGNVWKRFWWTQLGGRGGVTGTYLVGTRKAAKQPVIHRTAPCRELSSQKCSRCWGWEFLP